MTKLRQIQGKLTDSERKAADKVVQNFVDLNVPVDSEILELCSKTGHVSASIQTRGFYKVDILNEDMPTLRNLQRNNLYRYPLKIQLFLSQKQPKYTYLQSLTIQELHLEGGERHRFDRTEGGEL